MPPYNGHRSWNAWNVALWIGGDEVLYRLALECNHRHKNTGLAALEFIEAIGGPGTKTPDGATYNLTCVRLALAGLKE